MLGKIKNIFKPEKIVLSNGKEIQPKASVAPFVLLKRCEPLGVVVRTTITVELPGGSVVCTEGGT